MNRLSEQAAWQQVRDTAQVLRNANDAWIRSQGYQLSELAGAMLDQLGRGLHKNPLVIYGNPPSGALEQMSRKVYAIEYRHEEDGEDYRHDFGPGVEMHAMKDGSVRLTHHKRSPLHEEFP